MEDPLQGVPMTVHDAVLDKPNTPAAGADVRFRCPQGLVAFVCGDSRRRAHPVIAIRGASKA